MDDRFELLVVAVDRFAELPELPSTITAQRLCDMLVPYGAERRPGPRTKTANGVRRHLDAWSRSEVGPTSTVVYWVGHGQSDGAEQWLLASDSKPQYTPANALPAAELARYLSSRWANRVAGDPDAWTLIVLDSCNPFVGGLNVLNALSARPEGMPDRFAILPVASGASTVGLFVDALHAALNARSVYDDRILLRSLLEEVGSRLGHGARPINFLSYDASILNPARGAATAAVSAEKLEEWRDVVGGLDPDLRAHFLDKTGPAQVEDAAWMLAGRQEEPGRIAAWLRNERRGLFVVTGEPGAGKSALLGHVATLADQRVAAALAHSDLLAHRPADERPPPGVFDLVLHLTGKTLGEVVSRVAELVPGRAGIGPVVDGLRTSGRSWTILADALDEAQEPVVIARELLRPLSELPSVRVVLGTRRSMGEGADLPEPPSHELLDALGVGIADCLFLTREPPAMADYARRRLGPTRVPAAIVDDVAFRVADVDQPFLFARLAADEVLARTGAGDEPELDRLFSGDHRQVFAMALERLGRSSSVVVALLRALAYGLGRGVPRADGVWATIAAAIEPAATVTEAQIDETLRVAAAYVTLDGEGGQSVYRLSHKTFAAHFHAQDDLAAHARIAAALRRAADAAGGWHVANPYLLLHLLEHARSDAMELDALCTDPGFLQETLRRLGADGLVENLVVVKGAAGTAAPAVAGAVRRARVALTHQPDQLASQLQARLHAETDPSVVHLLDRLPEIAPPVWLRSLTSHLTWTGDLEANQDFPGKVRALAFGAVDGVAVLAVGVERSVHLWDPLAGGTDQRTVGNGTDRIIAVGLGARAGRPVMVMSSYEGTVALRDIRTGEPLLQLTGVGTLTSVCLGSVAGREVIAGANGPVVWWWDAASGDLLGQRDLGGGFQTMALAPTAGGIVAGAVNAGNVYVAPLEGTDMGRPWACPLGWPLRALSVAEVDGRIVVAAGDIDQRVGCWEFSGETAAAVAPMGVVVVDFPVRTVAVAAVDGRVVVAAGNDAWDSPGEIYGRVALRDPQRPHGVATQWPSRPVAINRTERGLVALCEGPPLRLLGVPDGDLVTGDPTAADVAGVLTAGRYPGLNFVDQSPDGDRLRPGTPARSGRRSPRRTTFRRADPASWPVTADAYGTLAGRPVRATGTLFGGSWVWDLDWGRVVAGPFARLPETVPLVLAMGKPGVPAVRSMSLCTTGERTLLGTVHDGAAHVWDVATGREVEIAAEGKWSAIALGEVGDQVILALGSDAGTLRLWGVQPGAGAPMASMTTDSRVRELWLVHGEATLAAMTYSNELLLFDFS